MATVAQVAKTALQRILVQASEAQFEADEYQDFIFSLNTYMASLEAEGIYLGFTPVDSLDDEITVSPGAIRGIIANLAIEVSPDYGGVISPALIAQAAQGLKNMRLLGQSISSTKYPGNLPVGSGLEEGYWNSPLYPGADDFSDDY